MTSAQLSFLTSAAQAADVAGHIFPQMAACEAALESNYGCSLLAVRDKNLFGMKQHRHAEYGTQILPTREFEGGEWVTINSSFVVYPNWQACFKDRMVTLLRLQSVYPNYFDALHATTPEDYVIAVSKTWATDPNRGQKVLDIYNEWLPAPAPDVDSEIAT